MTTATNGHATTPEVVPAALPATLVVRVEPWGADAANTTFLLPFLITRVGRMAMESHTEAAAKLALGKILAGDPHTMLLAFVKASRVVGHCLAWLEDVGDGPRVFVLQCELDRRVDGGDVIARGIALVSAWGKARGATRIDMATTRAPEAWAKAHGFTVARWLMTRPIES